MQVALPVSAVSLSISRSPSASVGVLVRWLVCLSVSLSLSPAYPCFFLLPPCSVASLVSRARAAHRSDITSLTLLCPVSFLSISFLSFFLSASLSLSCFPLFLSLHQCFVRSFSCLTLSSSLLLASAQLFAPVINVMVYDQRPLGRVLVGATAIPIAPYLPWIM